METKKISVHHDFDKIINKMSINFGTLKDIGEDSAMVMFAFESNLLKINRRLRINNSHRALEAIKICLFNVDGYIEGCKYDTAKFNSHDTSEYIAAIQYAFDPFVNDELAAAVGNSYDLDDPDDLRSYFEMPVKCMLRIVASIEKLEKNYGASGYFEFVEEQIGRMVKNDKFHYTALIKKNLPISEDMLTAGQLAKEERDMFFATWMPLLAFVNKKMNLVDFDITDKKQLQCKDYYNKIQQIRDSLWMAPGLIRNYIDINVNSLSEKSISLLESWQRNHIKSQFVVVEYEFEHAVFMRLEEGYEHRVYAVKGITDSVAVTLGRSAPILLETVLLPFGDKIIYDGLFAINQVVLGPNIKEMLDEEYRIALEMYGIATKLP